MFTRKQYLNGECSHRDYYGQFVTDNHKATVINYRLDGADKTPLNVWDNTYLAPLAIDMVQVGDTLTLSGKVCILKEACRQNN